jgi:raffinose/stachyose/melibiose transport system substrate-binding protein
MNKRVSLLPLTLALIAVLAACGSVPTAAPTTAPATGATAAPAALGAVTIHFLSAQAEDEPNYSNVISDLSREFQAQHPTVVYKYEQTPQTGLEEKILLLAGSDSLPTLFASPATGTLVEMYDKGLVLDAEQAFKDLGIFDTLKPVAVDLIKNINNGKMAALPTELNIEGFWYNKQIFADNGIQVPTTWDQLVQAAETLHGKGIQPFAASGEQGWPLTRLIGNYALRKLGPDALDRVARGELKLTDPGFVEAAQAVQDLGTQGYFGEGVATIDYATAVDQFLQGQAAMLYMGSWVLGDFNNPERNKIGVDNIGLFNFPTVTDGKGTADDWVMNAGLTVSLSKARYDENPQAVGEWLKYVFTRYGDHAMNDHGLITGFVVKNPPAEVPPLNQTVQATIDAVKTPTLWFEGRFDAEATTMSQRNAVLLVMGDMTPEQFLGDLQQVLEK